MTMTYISFKCDYDNYLFILCKFYSFILIFWPRSFIQVWGIGIKFPYSDLCLYLGLRKRNIGVIFYVAN
jgi:hypothetical protein